MYIWILIYSIMAHSKCNNYKMVFVSDYCSYYWQCFIPTYQYITITIVITDWNTTSTYTHCKQNTNILCQLLLVLHINGGQLLFRMVGSFCCISLRISIRCNCKSYLPFCVIKHCQLGKPHDVRVNGGFSGKIIHKWWIFQQTMFDYRRVSPMLFTMSA